jgi:pyruvate carboxylase subunit B
VTVDGVPEEVVVESLSGSSPQTAGGTADRSRTTGTRPGGVSSSMPGTVVEVLVSPGEEVKEGEVVLVIEAMKMEYQVCASRSGRVAAVHTRRGGSVVPDEVLMDIE